MFTVEATGIHLHNGSEPNFAITSERHPQGAWVVAENSGDQPGFYNKAVQAVQNGFGLAIVCERYEDQGDARRFYWGVEHVYLSSEFDYAQLNRELISRLPPLSSFIKQEQRPSK